MKSPVRIFVSSWQISLLAAFALLAPAFPSARAATEYWAGVPGASANTNWSTAGNWTAPQQTYFNAVIFTGTGASANNVFAVNNVLDSIAAPGPSQMPIYELDFTPTNGNYTTLINRGITMTIGAGNGNLRAGADQLHTGTPATANAVETISIDGQGSTLSMAGSLYVGQGSLTPLDSHNVTLDLSGLDNFVMTASGNYIYVASSVAARANGVLNLARTNNITLGNGIQMCNESGSSSNSQPVSINLGISNSITLGSSGNFNIGQTGTSTNGAFVQFNPSFLGQANPPSATFNSSASNGRINNIYVCNVSQAFPAYAACNLSGGVVNMLVATLNVALAGAAGGNSTGVLTFDNGIINASGVYIGRQQTSAGGFASGTVNINSNANYGASATLSVSGTLSMAAVTGTLTPGTAANININGGTLSAGAITNGTGASSIQSTLGTITLGTTAGSLVSPLGTLAVTNTTFNLAVVLGATNIVATHLNTGGATNIINITFVPQVSSSSFYPAQFPMIKFTSLSGAGYNFGLGTLPPLCSGYMTNDTANSSVDLVLTSGPVADTWDGAISGDWDTTTTNWNAGTALYADGNFTVFPDSASNGMVNLTATFMPAGVTVSNNALAYIFNGGGAIAGSTSLIKAGPGNLDIDNSGGNSFTGNISITGGSLQVGNNDTSGNLPSGNVANGGLLVFDRQDQVAVPNNISGAGTLVQAGGGTLQLTGANTFTGPVLVTNSSTLQLGSASAVGVGTNSLVVSSGSTLDADGFACIKPIVVSGTGVNGNGAIINSGGGIYDSGIGLATNVTLAGDTYFNITGNRWDLGAPAAGNVLSTGGNPYNLTISALGYFEWKNLAVDPKLGNINLLSGTFGMVGSTTFGNPASNLVVSSTAAVDLYGTAVYLNKGIDLQNGYINNKSGNNIMNGLLTLEPGYCSFNIGDGTTLIMSNVLTGSGVFYQSGGAGICTLTGNSPNFTGGISLYNGQITLNGVIGSGVTTEYGTTLAGSGVASNLVDVAGAFLPGGASKAGTFTAAGGLVLENPAALTMDLSSTTAVGGGVNDLIVVDGDLTVNGNNITINPLSGTLANGVYTLFTYTGNLNGSFGTASTPTSSRYNFTIDTSLANTVRLIVTGVPNLLVWNNDANNSQWDVQTSYNWTNLTTHLEDQFFTADTAVLDDSESLAPNPSANLVIPAGQVVIPGLLTNGSSVNYSISGAGKISGGARIVKQGASTLTLATTNDFSGGITILGGTVVGHSKSSLGTGAVTVTNNATVDIGYALGSTPLVVSGAGVGGNGAIVNDSGNPLYDSSAGLTASITLEGNTTFGGTTRWDLGDRGVSGATLSTGGNAFNLTYTGSAGLYFEWDNLTLDTNLAGITILPNLTLGAIGNTTFGNPTNVLTISSNATVVFYTDAGFSPVVNKQILIMNDGVLQNGSGGTVTLGPIVLGTNQGDVCGFNIGGSWLAVSNSISGPGALFKFNSGSPLYLAGANNYTGNTIISNGVLALVGPGAIASSPAIYVASGATLDVSARTDQTLTLASGQVLSGSGVINGNLTEGADATVWPATPNAIGTLTVTNAVTLSGSTTMDINEMAGTQDQIVAGGAITYGGTLNVTNLAGVLAASNSFKLFTASSYSGAFSAIAPPTPGAGLMWNTTTLSNGTLSVSQAVSVPPTISSITLSGGNLIISGTNNTGSAGSYSVRTSTNLAQTIADWAVLTNGTFNSDGSFSTTNTIGNGPQQFYRIETP